MATPRTRNERLANILAFALWGGLFGRYPVAMVAPYALLIPLFGIASGVLIYDETFTRAELIGAAVVVAGATTNCPLAFPVAGSKKRTVPSKPAAATVPPSGFHDNA